MKQMSIYRVLVFLLIGLTGMVSCTKEENNTTAGEWDKDFHPYVLVLAILGSQGGALDYSYYAVPYEDVMQGTLDAVHKGTENAGDYDFVHYGQTIYAMSSPYGKHEVVGIRKNNPIGRVEKFGKR